MDRTRTTLENVLRFYVPAGVLLAIAGPAWARFGQPLDQKVASTIAGLAVAVALSYATRAAIVIARSDRLAPRGTSSPRSLLIQGFVTFGLALVLCVIGWYLSGTYYRTTTDTEYCKYINATSYVRISPIPAGTTLRKAESLVSLSSLSGIDTSKHPMVAVKDGLVTRYTDRDCVEVVRHPLVPPIFGAVLYIGALVLGLFGTAKWYRGFSSVHTVPGESIAGDSAASVEPDAAT